MSASEINTNIGNPVSIRSHADQVCARQNPKSQNGRLLNHLLRVGSITQLEANELYRIHRLASRINDLKNLGVSIYALPLIDPTGVKYVRYQLAGN
jgi:hypothetical protein